jgi:hypothetical protein
MIERTFFWLCRNRRLMAYHESLAMIALAMIVIKQKRLMEVASRSILQTSDSGS